jgi:L-lactate dehydrogenase complex protein LldE
LTLFNDDWPVVVPSGSCAGMMKHHYPTLFAADPVRKAQAEQLSTRIYELTDFLVHVLDFTPKISAETAPSSCIPPALPDARWVFT